MPVAERLRHVGDVPTPSTSRRPRNSSPVAVVTTYAVPLQCSTCSTESGCPNRTLSSRSAAQRQ